MKALPLPSDSVDVMAAIHVLEHFYRWEAVDVLKEWKRVLKPGGTLILELPSMDKVFNYITDCLTKNKGRYQVQMTWWAIYGDPKHQDPTMCHKWGYTEALLREAVQQAGFMTMTVSEPRYHIAKRDMRLTAVKETAC